MPLQTTGEMGLTMFNDAKAAISMGRMDVLTCLSSGITCFPNVSICIVGENCHSHIGEARTTPLTGLLRVGNLSVCGQILSQQWDSYRVLMKKVRIGSGFFSKRSMTKKI